MGKIRLNRNDFLPFGKKHAGKTIGEIVDIDPNYLLWWQDQSKVYVFSLELKQEVLRKSVND